LILLARIIWRHLPELKILDINSIPKEKHVDTKAKILESKFLRQSDKTRQRLDKVIGPIKAGVGGLKSRLQEQVQTLEKKYQRHGEVEEAKTKSINDLFVEAEQLLAKDDLAAAERDLIEIISRDKKSIRAYELLSDVYRSGKNYEQAAEVIKYLIKLKSLKYRKKNPVEPLQKEKLEDTEAAMLETINVDVEIAGYYDDLGKVYEILGKIDKALDNYLKANAIEPNNPKYLDKVIDLAILVKDKGLAKKTYRQLKEINPENAKLARFKEALEKM
jgi:tetratricopeptide (TPR) repeat protein